MCERRLLAALALLALSFPVRAETPPDAAALLAAADRWRSPFAGAATADPSFEIEARIVPIRKGQEEEAVAYRIRVQGESGASLAEAMSGDSRGQRYLLTDDGAWFFAPRTRRAIRIPMTQRATGEAAIGDVARLQWVRDYTATIAAPAPVECPRAGRCWALTLVAKSENATYAGIDLLVAVADAAPVSAAYRVASGKIIKRGDFGSPEAEADGTYVRRIALANAVQTGNLTIMTYAGARIARFPAALFTAQGMSQ
ncbi:MAG: outer membrane lipoprotein-sorting protein [Alphaproteobacteria bacterium]|nr:outer membrane lipoprotein-sorting protein [Alphaproteobacteria bacterium]